MVVGKLFSCDTHHAAYLFDKSNATERLVDLFFLGFHVESVFLCPLLLPKGGFSDICTLLYLFLLKSIQLNVCAFGFL